MDADELQGVQERLMDFAADVCTPLVRFNQLGLVPPVEFESSYYAGAAGISVPASRVCETRGTPKPPRN